MIMIIIYTQVFSSLISDSGRWQQRPVYLNEAIMNKKFVEILNTGFSTSNTAINDKGEEADAKNLNNTVSREIVETRENEWQMEYRLIYGSYKMDYAEN